MIKFLKYIFSKKARNAEVEKLKNDITLLEEERMKEKSSHRVRQHRKYRLIEQIKEKRKELESLQLETQEI